MQFVRENMFLVALVAVVVVVGGVMLAVDFNLADKVDARLAERSKTANSLASLDRRKPTNTKVLAANREIARRYQVDAKRMEDEHVAWNVRRYEVLHLPIYKGSSLLLDWQDILQWPVLMAKLRGDAGAHRDFPPAGKVSSTLWGLLTKETRQQMPAAGTPMTVQQRDVLLAGLNQIIGNPEFYQVDKFPRVALPAETWPLLRKRALSRTAAEGAEARKPGPELTELEVQRLNRLVLETFYPNVIAKSQVPAFPMNMELYKQFSLRYHYQQQYREAMRALLARLNPTAPATATELAIEEKRWAKLIDQYLKQEETIKRKAAEATGAGEDTRRGMCTGLPMSEYGRMMPDMVRMRDHTRRLKSSKGKAGEDERVMDVKLLAAESAKIRKAMQGYMYASLASLSLVFPEGQSVASPPDSELWWAQIGLWITRDIVDAIILTNRDVLTKVSAKERSVMSAAIKHLVEVKVAKYYVGRKPETTGKRTEELPIEMGLPVMGGDRPSGRGRSRGDTAPTLRKALSLTMRVTEPEYDLVRYRLRVVMPARHLPKLQEKLLALNYHTILSVSMLEVPSAYRDVYYYGTEPVMLVEMTGELMLLSSWTRGKWAPRKRQWLSWNHDRKAAAGAGTDRPINWIAGQPLMPVTVLRQQVPTFALRPEDQRRATVPETPSAPGTMGVGGPQTRPSLPG